MSSSIAKVNYDELTQIAKQLHAESEDCTRLNSQTCQRMDALRGGWEGDAAKAFFNEMNAELIPATQRLSSALLAGESVLNQIMRITYEADQETASYFKGLDTGGDGAVKRTRVYLINGIDYQNDKDLDDLKRQFDGKNIDVIIVGAHPYDSNFQQYAKNIATHFGGWLTPLDWATGKVADSLGPLNKAFGLGQVINEYVTGGSTQSEKVYRWIEADLRNNGLIGDSNVNVILVGHSGGGAIAANIIGNIEDKLGVNVSGLVTMGSPFSNYDQASKYGVKILDIQNQADLFGTPLGLGTLRSDEMRGGMIGGLINKWSVPASFALDPYFRDSTVNVQNITTVDGGYAWWDPRTWGDAHNSYFTSPDTANAILQLANQ